MDFQVTAAKNLSLFFDSDGKAGNNLDMMPSRSSAAVPYDAAEPMETQNVISHTDMIENQIAMIFSQQLNTEVPGWQTDLVDTGILDSLKFVDLLLLIEQRFGVRVDLGEIDLQNFRSIEKIAQFVRERGAESK